MHTAEIAGHCVRAVQAMMQSEAQFGAVLTGGREAPPAAAARQFAQLCLGQLKTVRSAVRSL